MFCVSQFLLICYSVSMIPTQLSHFEISSVCIFNPLFYPTWDTFILIVELNHHHCWLTCYDKDYFVNNICAVLSSALCLLVDFWYSVRMLCTLKEYWHDHCGWKDWYYILMVIKTSWQSSNISGMNHFVKFLEICISFEWFEEREAVNSILVMKHTFIF
jgi:hypothetical protein